jgi:hypothetical protein
MEAVLCFGFGMIIGGALFGVAGYILGKTYKAKKDILEAEERKAEIRLKKQWANFAAYNGSSERQEEID